MTISVSAHGGAYTRTLKSEKLLAKLCHVVGAIVVTNDWPTMLHTIVPLITAYCFVFMVLSRKLPSLEHHHTDVMFRMSQKSLLIVFVSGSITTQVVFTQKEEEA